MLSNIVSDLVFDYGVSEVIRKVTHGGHVPFFLHILSGTGAFKELQLVFDPLESSEVTSACMLVCSGRRIHTRIDFSVA